MNHSEFLKSIRDGDGRKWIVEEVRGQSVYLEVIDERNPYARTGNGPLALHYMKARAQLNKRVSKPEKPFTWRLGYNHCIGQPVPRDSNYPNLSGSSLNRKKKESKKYKPTGKPVLHTFSTRSRGKVKDKATAFFRSIPRDRIFLTLTFIQHVDDREGIRILNKFLTVVRKERPGFEYLRIAEHQPEREEHTIHFHILMNRPLPVHRYNALWVLQQYNAGLRGVRRSTGEEIPLQEILQRYDDGTIGKVLNPMDVCRAHSANGLAAYLTKYVTKQKKGETFGCRTWHCSRKVSKLFTRQVVGPSTFRYLHSFANWRVNFKTGECQPPSKYATNHFTMIYVENKKAVIIRLSMLEQVNKWLLAHFEPGEISRIDDDFYRKFISHDRPETHSGDSIPVRITPGRTATTATTKPRDGTLYKAYQRIRDNNSLPGGILDTAKNDLRRRRREADAPVFQKHDAEGP